MTFSPSVWGGSVMLRRRSLSGMRRSHRRRHSRRGGSAASYFAGMGRRRSRRHSRRGRGLWDSIKNIGRKAIEFGGPIVKDLAIKAVRSQLGVGRRRRRRRLGRSMMTPYFGTSGMRRRRTHSRRRVGRGNPLFQLLGIGRGRSRRRRTRRGRSTGGVRPSRMIQGARRHRRRVGRGIFGPILGSVLGRLLPF